MSFLPLQRLLLALVERPRASLRIIGLAVLLLLPCLSAGLALDDYVLALKAQPVTRMAAVPIQPLQLFTFTTGDPAQNAALMDEAALLPWWSEPRHLNAFFRPLSALTHVLDFRAWPAAPWLMHLQSLLWYALLYAIDDAHGATVGWIANRNALVSATLALPALSAHVQPGRSRWLAPLWLFLGLCAGETAFCMLGYLCAYALHLDKRSARARLLSLAPYALLFVGHRALYHVFHLGSYGSAAYHEPLREPIAFALTLGYNLPVLLSAQLFAPLADLGFWGDGPTRAALWVISVVTLFACGKYGAMLWRYDRMVRFWATGMLLAAAPVSASLPGERLLIAVGFGAAPLLARVLIDAHVLSDVTLPHGPRRGLISALVALHLLLAPVMLPLRARSFHLLDNATARLDRAVPYDPHKTVVVLNAPLNIMLSYLQIARAWRGEPRPEHFYWLSTASSTTRVTRTAADALELEQERGFLFRPEDMHYRANVQTLGPTLERSGMQIEVVAKRDDGRPSRVRFRFAQPLAAASYDFRVYRDGELVPWHGQDLSLPPVDFLQVLLTEALR